MEHPLSQFKYCPKCGSAHFEVHNEKSKQCADCGFVYYFNPSSATVALILNERDELLVCRRAKEPAKGTLDLPGGFIDMTETGEEGVAREVREETGMKVAKAEYLFSLPNIYIYSGFPRTHAGYVFPLYGGGHLALQGDGRRGRPLLPPLKRYPYERVRARLHPQRSGYLPGRHAEEQKRMIIRSYYGIYPKKAKQV